VDELAQLGEAGVARGDLVGLAAGPGPRIGLSAAGRPLLAGADAVRLADEKLRPRWVIWSGETAATLAARGVRLATCWDIAAVHRLLFGGWRADPGWVWAHLQELALATIPARGSGCPQPAGRSWPTRTPCASPTRSCGPAG
jgi:DNA polymerase-1